MTLGPGHTDWKALAEHHRTVTLLLLLALIFATGLIEREVLKDKGWASVTWFIGLMVLVFWIAHSWTTGSILAATTVGASGLVALVIYYRRD